MCNQNLKFGRLIDRADQLGAQYIATGHFARVEFSPSPNGRADLPVSLDAQQRVPTKGERHLLKRGRDSEERPELLSFFVATGPAGARFVFCSAKKTKSDTREVARHCQLKTADKEESMEICFVPDKDYGKFLREANLAQKHRGEIVDLHGQVLGHHDGIEFYTIGQRKGLGITTPRPVYVIDLDAERNPVVVGDDAALDRDEFIVERCNWHPFDELSAPAEVTAKIRYNHPGAAATVAPLGQGRAKVKLYEPQRAITPGQAAVFYQDDQVVGGGWIMK